MTNCAEGGVVGMVPGIIGLIEALEAVKIIVGVSEKDIITKRMLIFDGKCGTFKMIKIRGR